MSPGASGKDRWFSTSKEIISSLSAENPLNHHRQEFQRLGRDGLVLARNEFHSGCILISDLSVRAVAEGIAFCLPTTPQSLATIVIT